jgi:HAE1 family hydrophobic/amphiphilic exporter-1
MSGTYRPETGEDKTIRLVTNLDGLSPNSSTLPRIHLKTSAGTIVSLDSLTEIHPETGLSAIRRRDRARTLTVIGYTRDENIRGVSDRLNAALEKDPLNPDVGLRVRGVGGLVKDSIGRMALVLGVSLFLVYAVMAIQFERLVQPLIIMASVPFSFIGTIVGLAVFGSNISLISFLGIIALGGIVVNNSIVQVDRINQLRRSGMKLDDAVIEGAATRLRPILMTTLTTFFGVLPLSLADGPGARIYAPLGQAIAGGLITSTLVTLFLIPIIYRKVENRRMSRMNQELSAA